MPTIHRKFTEQGYASGAAAPPIETQYTALYHTNSNQRKLHKQHQHGGYINSTDMEATEQGESTQMKGLRNKLTTQPEGGLLLAPALTDVRSHRRPRVDGHDDSPLELKRRAQDQQRTQANSTSLSVTSSRHGRARTHAHPDNRNFSERARRNRSARAEGCLYLAPASSKR